MKKNSYRPIATLPILYKIHEIQMHDRNYAWVGK